MAGLHFAAQLRKRCADPILILSEESALPYDRIHLGQVLMGKDEEGLRLHDRDWYAEQNIEILVGHPVSAIDREACTVETVQGESFDYDRLILATGGRAFRPPIPGHRLDSVLTYRTLEDAQQIRRRAADANRVVIAGGGLLGLEAARAIQGLGCQTEIIEMAPRLLPRQLDREGAEVLERQLQRLGPKLRLLSRIEEIGESKRPGARLEVRLTDGHQIEADLVVFAAGIRPNDELAKSCDLACHHDGGILVDDGLKTSDPRIYAVGECARHRDRLYGFVAPCYEMAEVLADRLTGGERTFEGAVPSARLKIDEIDVAAVGDSLAEGIGYRELSWVEPEEYRRIVLRDGQIVGAIAVGAGSEFPKLQEAVAKRSQVRAWHERRFARSGRLWSAGNDTDLRHWPDAAIVCTCTGVTCGTLRQLCANGGSSSAALSDQSGAGTVCGNCWPLLEQLAGERPAAVRAGAGPGIGLVALAGLVLLGTAAVWGPLDYSATAITPPSLGGFEIDRLWRDGWWKQFSGFVLLGLCIASLALSLRKRWPRFRFGSFRGWRLLHGVLGVGALLATVVHSGFRMGANLNQALMIVFLGVLFLGSGAGLVTSLEHRLPGRWGSVLRRGWTSAHILLFGPLPVLILLHVLAVYVY